MFREGIASFPRSERNNKVVLKYLLLPAALVLAAIASLTVFRAPDTMWAWKLAMHAGEFGYWLVLPVVAVAVVAGTGLIGLPRTVTPPRAVRLGDRRLSASGFFGARTGCGLAGKFTTGIRFANFPDPHNATMCSRPSAG